MTAALVRWFVEGETGLSSKTMAAVAAGLTPPRPIHPLDPADLNRCIKLVDAVPDVKGAFPAIASLSPQWASVIEHWDELRGMFIAEAGYDWSQARTARQTSAHMKALGL